MPYSKMSRPKTDQNESTIATGQLRITKWKLTDDSVRSVFGQFIRGHKPPAVLPESRKVFDQRQLFLVIVGGP